jgi:thiamine-phosphate pyrophosphorylase
MSDGRSLAERLALIVVTDAECGTDRELVEVVRAALAGGAPAVQLRAKTETSREMVELASRLLVETRAAGALLFVNDRMDVALAVGADGAHLGNDDLPIPAARRIAPPGFLLGRSVETLAEAEQAIHDGADYLGVGPVYATLSKADAGPVIGAEGVRAMCDAAGPAPVVGIGGIDATNAGEVAGAGAAGVAVIRAVMLAADPGAAAAALLRSVRQRN